jgi:hypothetical protein
VRQLVPVSAMGEQIDRTIEVVPLAVLTSEPTASNL